MLDQESLTEDEKIEKALDKLKFHSNDADVYTVLKGLYEMLKNKDNNDQRIRENSSHDDNSIKCFGLSISDHTRHSSSSNRFANNSIIYSSLCWIGLFGLCFCSIYR